jgi:recombination protein RecA
MEAGIKNVIDIINKKFGKESLVGEVIEVEKISSTSLGLDIALGGGYAKGRIIEIFGWESSGKTTLALHLVSEIQKSGGRVGYIDTEHALDLFYAAALGCDVDITSDDPKFIVSQPNNGEDALGIANEMVKSGKFQLIVIDSVAALVPKALLLGEVGDQKMASTARLMSQWVPAIQISANQNNCIVVFINQMREKIGIMFGSPNTTSGGNALKFYASQRLEVSRVGQNKDGDEIISNKTRVKVIKNKVAVPFKQCEFNIVFGEGIDKYAEILDLASEMNIVNKSGSWYSYENTKLGQGADSVTSLLKDNPELFEEINLKVRTELGMVQETVKKEKKYKK